MWTSPCAGAYAGLRFQRRMLKDRSRIFIDRARGKIVKEDGQVQPKIQVEITLVRKDGTSIVV